MRTSIASTAVAGRSSPVGPAGAAHAEQFGIDDPKKTGHVSESSRSRRGTRSRVCTSSHSTRTRKDPACGDGSEYVFVAGCTKGTDCVLLEAEGFKPSQ